MPFSDPIVAGSTLVRDAIQSEPYIAGVTGWRIERDGDAEFNDVSVRGDLRVDALNNASFIAITNDQTSGNPIIVLQDPSGRQYVLSTNDDLDMVISHYGLGTLPATGSVHLVRGEGIAFRSSASSVATLFDGSDGFLKVGTYTPWSPEGWVTPTLQNGWNTTGVSAFSTPAYKRHVDGTVQLRGVMNNGTKTNGTLLFTLPADYRPPRRIEMDVTTDVAGNNQRIQIFGISDGASAGQVQIQGLGTGNTIGMDGKRFEVI